MASFRKSGKKWRAEVARNGIRDSETFDTKAEAQAWAAKREHEILNIKRGMFPRITLGEVMDEYVERVSPQKDGFVFEQRRVKAFKRDYAWMAEKVISEVSPSDWSRWRDARLDEVTGSSVNRDLNLFSNIFHTARKEWGYCGESPISSIKRPPENEARDARIPWQVVKRVCRHLGYRTGVVPTSKNEEVAHAVLIALRTSLRNQEILALSDDRVDFAKRVITSKHKMQYLTRKAKETPITKQAARLLKVLSGRGNYFSVSAASRDTLFRKAKGELGIDDITFHDTRGEALTLLSRKVDVYTLQRISGIKDIRILIARYYRETAQQVAARL